MRLRPGRGPHPGPPPAWSGGPANGARAALRTRLVALVLGGAALLLAGCGDDSSATDAGAASGDGNTGDGTDGDGGGTGGDGYDGFGRQVLLDLGDDDGIAVGGRYDAQARGAALLDVMADNDNVKSSNFGSRSFRLTNTGEKRIAALFIDVREALFPDSVVDFDGTGGDTAAKRFRVDGENVAGAFFDEDDARTYFLPGEAPLPDATGSDNPVSGGFRGLLLKFGEADGGCEPGEAVGFSGDMDPNSIAGLAKDRVDSDAIDGWDVGGVSGAEIAGSRFFVRFDDGSIAQGVLGPSGTQAGSLGAAIEGAPTVHVTLEVNGGASTYGGAEPVVALRGPPGQRVLVVLAKGLQPVTNDAPIDAGTVGPKTLVDDRLAQTHPGFPVNNAFDIQTAELTLDDDGRATLPSGALQYATTRSGIDFDGADTAPIVLGASAIDDDGLARGPVARAYLTNPTQTPAP